MANSLTRAARNGLIRSVHRSGLPRLRAGVLRHRHGQLYRVLCFHRVGDPAALRHKLHLVKEHYEFASLASLLSGGTGDSRVGVTFDDGYPEQMEVAAPILKEEHVPATFFIVSGAVGLSDDDAARFYRERVRTSQDRGPTAAAISRLAQDPLFEIGSHSRTHPDLGRPPAADELLSELAEAKRELEAMVHKPVVSFAYPFGGAANLSAAAADAVRATGYTSAFTILPGFNSPRTDRYRLHRDSLEPDMDDGLFLAWLEGSYDHLKAWSDLMRAPVRAWRRRRPARQHE